MRRCAVLCILALLMLPLAGAVVPDEPRQGVPIVTSPEFNTTGTDITNHTYPPQYRISPTLIDVKVEVSDTAIPGPKGEMATGPRSIGFTTDGVTLTILLVGIIAAAGGGWYLVRQKQGDIPEDNDERGE